MLLGALFYLVHSPVPSHCYAAAERLNVYKMIPEFVLAGIGICAGYLLAYLVYRFIEKPGIQLGKVVSKRLAQKLGYNTNQQPQSSVRESPLKE
jgi:peptidoglycan/LPS O-acetylase OafA/YrhL